MTAFPPHGSYSPASHARPADDIDRSDAECARCLGGGWCMEDPREEFESDRAIPCPFCDPVAHGKRLRGEVYWHWADPDAPDRVLREET